VAGRRVQTAGLTLLSHCRLLLRPKPAVSRGMMPVVNLASGEERINYLIRCAVLLDRRRAYMGAGTEIESRLLNTLNHSLDQTQPRWRSATGRRSGDAVVTEPSACWRGFGRPQWRREEVWWIGGRGLKGRSRSPASMAVAGPSRRRPAGTPGTSLASLSKKRRTGQTVEETVLPRHRVNKS
jgi:hypothetical protein